MTVVLQETPAGIVLPVNAQPGSRRSGVMGELAGSLKVAVTQVPEKGKANEAILEALIELFELKRHQLQLVSGATSSQKRFLVTGVSLNELRRQIEQLLIE